jgi:L-lactate dehydrogenase complex protein LldG
MIRTVPDVPLFDADRPASLLSAFKESLERMGGLFLDPPAAGDVLAPVRAKIASAKVVCSTAPEIAGNRDIASVRAPQELADVDFAIVRAAFAVAKMGSVLLSDSELHVNALAYLAQHLMVLLDPADIIFNIHHAYRRPEFRSPGGVFRSLFVRRSERRSSYIRKTIIFSWLISSIVQGMPPMP